MSMANPKPDLPQLPLKQQWRICLKELRDSLPASRRSSASRRACQHLVEACSGKGFILSFASFGTEIDLWPFNRELADQGRLVLPLVVEKQGLQLYQVAQFSELDPHHFGMLEPKATDCPAIPVEKIGIALLPGLGFDLKTHHRLGYGYGYYDRLLATARSMHTWGVGFLEQQVESLPYSEKDIPLHQIYLF